MDNIKYEITYKPYDDCGVSEWETKTGHIPFHWSDSDLFRSVGTSEHLVMRLIYDDTEDGERESMRRP